MYLTLDGEKVTSLSLKGEAVADYFEEKKDTLETDKYHLEGDSLFMKIDEEKMEFIEIFKQGLASHIISNDTMNINEMTGEFLKLNFIKEKINDAIIRGNAHSTYFYYDKKKYKGKNVSSGDTISLFFDKGKVNGIQIQGNVKGKYLGASSKKKKKKDEDDEPETDDEK